MPVDTYTFPSIIIQTYLTITAKRWGQFPTITFSNGATAGSEVVTVASDLSNINVQIQSGTSTMLQIATAINSTAGSATGLSAGDLVSVVVTSGHNSDVVKTFSQAKLAGGITTSTKSTITIGHLVYTAKTAGTTYNDIRIKYTSGATLTVTVSTHDITVRLRDDGTTTNADIIAAIVASSPANTLVAVTSDGLATSFIPTTAMASSFISLAGAVDATPASVVVQGVTITSNTNDATQNGKTITCADTVEAGSETVTVSSGNVTINMDDGESTVTQIVTALNAAGAFTTLYSASGSSSTAVLTVNAVILTGAAGPNYPGYYSDQSTTALTSSFVAFPFNFLGKIFTLSNDETATGKNIVFSWDGINTHGTILFNETYTVDDINLTLVYLKYSGGAPNYRLMVQGA